MSKELMPCPLCGSDDLQIRSKQIRSEYSNFVEKIYVVYCECCKNRGRMRTSIDAAIESWNLTLREKRLADHAPEMYELMKATAEYIFDCEKLYSPFPHELVTYAERIQKLLARIEGKEDAHE